MYNELRLDLFFMKYGKGKDGSRVEKAQKLFNKALQENWNEVFFDNCTDDWTDRWFLDGKKASIANTKDGMDFHAGKVFLDDSCHAVLWTKESFNGDIRIEFNYTRLDDESRCVNILYIQATGIDNGPYAKDITKWSELREIPSMSHYFDKMHTYHISFAAFDNEFSRKPKEGYIRARRYMGNGLEGTELTPEYPPEGFFSRGEKHKMIFVKTGNDIFFHITNSTGSKLCHWHNDKFPGIEEGRIGIRHMFTRAARYKNIRIFVKDSK